MAKEIDDVQICRHPFSGDFRFKKIT